MIENPQVGDRVRIVTEIGGAHGSPGNVGTIERIDGPATLGIKMDEASSYEGAYGGGVYQASPSNVERLAVPADPYLLAVGTRIRLTRDVDGEPRGREGEIIRALSDGYYQCNLRPAGPSVWYVTPEQLEAVAPGAPALLPFEVGCRVELVREFGGAPVGTKGTMVRTCCGGIDAWFTVEGQPGEHRVEFSHLRVLPPEPASPVPADATLADLQAQKQRAERELQEFKDLVHRRVCEISEERNWCTDADAWLEGLGLPPREPEETDYSELVPQGEYAVVRISGGALAIRKDDDDEPWYVIDSGSYGYSGYMSDEAIYEADPVLLWEGRDY